MKETIPTHHNPIWTETNCQELEDDIKHRLAEAAGDQAHVEAIDIITRHDPDQQIPKNRRYLITDNHFNVKTTPSKVIQLGPEMWGIYAQDPNKVPEFKKPMFKFNCLMHRISGERLELLYKLHERDLIDTNLVSFCCFRNKKDRLFLERRIDFNDVHIEEDMHCYNTHQEELRRTMPLVLPTGMTPDDAAEKSEVTIVVETYVHSEVIAFSEKIFRALQLPRPWVMYNSPNAVDVLRSYGFDVLDDIVDHKYDIVEERSRRADGVINAALRVKPFDTIDPERLDHAAKHNRQLLNDLLIGLEPKVQSIIDQFK